MDEREQDRSEMENPPPRTVSLSGTSEGGSDDSVGEEEESDGEE